MPNETLARRYATAVFSLAQEGDVVAKVGADLSALADAIYADPTTAAYFTAPIVDRYEKERALTAVFNGKVDVIALHAMLLLVRKHREPLLRELVNQYRTLGRRSRGIEPLTVATAKPLAEGELRDLVARLEKIYGKTFEVTQQVDPELIGGVRVTMGDRRIDGTVAGRLEELSRTLFAQN
ncbi:MAG TPA: ATP synthase F1 subunit delta [Candidatus Baltobacteraceae bacterium]